MGPRCRAATAVVAVALFAVPGTAGAAPPEWETDVGAPIPALSDDDDAATTIPLGTFELPFYGTTYSDLTISSNGFVMPGVHGSPATSNDPNGVTLTTQGPRIAPYWTDLWTNDLPPDQGQVSLNTFDDDADPEIDRVVVTWQANIFECPGIAAYPACAVDAQVQLFETGRIVFGYDRLHGTAPQGVLAGVSKGGLPAADTPRSTDLAGTGFPLTIGAVGYELFTGSPLRSGLTGRSLVFTPVGTTGFTVDQLGSDVAVSLSATPAATVGGRVSSVATVTNRGEAPATGVTLADAIPSGAALASAPGCTGTVALTCALGTLAPGESKAVGIELTATAPGTLVNTVTVDTADGGDPAPDNLASASTTVTAPPPDVGPPDPGAVDVRVRRVRQNLARVARRRAIRIRIACSAECSASARASVNRRTARRLRTRSRTLGRATGGRTSAGATTLELPLGRRVARRIAGMRSLRVTVTTTFSTADGERVVTSNLTIQR
jgi:uncharacterized repeat protein (TIGR01451 family)